MEAVHHPRHVLLLVDVGRLRMEDGRQAPVDATQSTTKRCEMVGQFRSVNFHGIGLSSWISAGSFSPYLRHCSGSSDSGFFREDLLAMFFFCFFFLLSSFSWSFYEIILDNIFMAD